MKEKINELFKNTKEMYYINDQVFLVEADKTYIIKKIKKPIIKIYKLLKSNHVDNVIYPIKEFEYKNEYYYVFNYIEETYLNKEKHLIDMIDSLSYIHEKTGFKKKVTDMEFKKFKRIYKKLDYSFLMLESIVRKSEMNEKKNDFDWIILSKYYVYLDVKKEMYKLQLKLHEGIKKGLELKYSVTHNKASLAHYINNYFISLDSSKISYYVSDLAKLYVLNDYININWEEEMNKYIDEFGKIYFKFFVLYIYILNLDFDSSSIFIDNYLNISKSIKKFLKTFENYK